VRYARSKVELPGVVGRVCEPSMGRPFFGLLLGLFFRPTTVVGADAGA
jgi:hypothetical protein